MNKFQLLYEKIKNIKNYEKVYRGGKRGRWVSDDKLFATEYGKVKTLYIPSDLNLLEIGTTESDQIADELNADDLDLYYNPPKELEYKLQKLGYDGFINDKNIFIIDINNIKSKEQL